MMIAAAEPELRRGMLAVNMSASIAVFLAIVNPLWANLSFLWASLWITPVPKTDKGLLCG
jgi:hypothetical protein